MGMYIWLILVAGLGGVLCGELGVGELGRH